MVHRYVVYQRTAGIAYHIRYSFSIEHTHHSPHIDIRTEAAVDNCIASLFEPVEYTLPLIRVSKLDSWVNDNDHSLVLDLGHKYCCVVNIVSRLVRAHLQTLTAANALININGSDYLSIIKFFSDVGFRSRANSYTRITARTPFRSDYDNILH